CFLTEHAHAQQIAGADPLGLWRRCAIARQVVNPDVSAGAAAARARSEDERGEETRHGARSLERAVHDSWACPEHEPRTCKKRRLREPKLRRTFARRVLRNCSRRPSPARRSRLWYAIRIRRS